MRPLKSDQFPTQIILIPTWDGLESMPASVRNFAVPKNGLSSILRNTEICCSLSRMANDSASYLFAGQPDPGA